MNKNHDTVRWNTALIQIIIFVLVYNRSSGSVQAEYPIKHQWNISLSPTHKKKSAYSTVVKLKTFHYHSPLSLNVRQLTLLCWICLTQQQKLIERLLSRQTLLRNSDAEQSNYSLTGQRRKRRCWREDRRSTVGVFSVQILMSTKSHCCWQATLVKHMQTHLPVQT